MTSVTWLVPHLLAADLTYDTLDSSAASWVKIMLTLGYRGLRAHQ